MASVKSREEQDDDPPMSRLFIICNKTNTEEEFRETFSKFGTIEEIWIVKDKLSGEHKGVAYIKFSKTSEAARALEEMNGKLIGKSQRPIKVLVASSRNQGRTKTENEFEKYIRLFVIVPKEMTEKDLTDEFSIYGDLDSISLIRDKSTGERKGFAYVKYHKFSDAAKAFESCDRRFKAVFAEPKPMRQNSASSLSLAFDGSSPGLEGLSRRVSGGAKDFFSPMPGTAFGNPLGNRSFNNSAIFVKMATNGDRIPPGATAANANGQVGILPTATGPSSHPDFSLNVICSALVNQDQLWRLFDIIPGLDYCQIIGESGPNGNRAIVKYNNLESCTYAKEKLHGLEYPLGERLIVKMDLVPGGANALLAVATSSPNSRGPLNCGGGGDLQLTQLDRENNNLCSVPLPPPATLAYPGSVCAQRCFIVCVSQSLPIPILRNVFSRFGNLIDIYLLPNKNCGYAKYATEESCRTAIDTLHGAEICGVRMRVMEAEELSSDRKRLRRDE